MIHNAPRPITLQARDLTVKAGGRVLLQPTSLAIYPGELVALIGPSGAGKSTLLTALCGFRHATGGHVLANGEDLYCNFNAYRTAIGYVPQDDIVHMDLSVYKVLRYAALLRLPPDLPRADLQRRVDEVLGQMGLAERRDVLVRRLSGGQRKRVSIGVELLSRPPLLFLDEPTSGLDPALEEKMMHLLQGLAREGRAVIVTTHAMQSLEYVDFVAIVAQGRLVYFGPPGVTLAFFQVDDWGDLFRALEDRSPAACQTAFLKSPLCQQYIAQRLRQAPASQPAAAPVSVTPAPAPAPPSVEDELAALKRKLSGNDPEAS